jgi:dolichol-phosphate mannosyltransferase
MHHRAVRRDLLLVETPIRFAERRAGTSKMSLATQWESAVLPWRLRFQERRAQRADRT